ncbi:MAG: MFS transporter [Chloroflexi bacterium]|nr:MAG: MFS transporter [Chloroflexota bacterium]
MLKNAKIITLFFTMVVVMIGFGIIIPIMPFYIEHFGAGGTELGIMMASFSIAQFVSSPFWGSLSDRYGRKKIMIIGVLGNAASMVMTGLAPNLLMLFASRAFAGFLSSATLPTAMAYISDTTSEDDRGGGMGLMGAAMGVGMVLGPGLGGLVAGDNLSTPFFLAAGMSAIAFLMVLFFLPESLPEEMRINQPGRRFNGPQLGVLWKALFGPLGFLMFLAFLVNFALANFEGIFGLYTDERFGYGPQQVGTVLMVVGIVSSIVQGIFTGPATRKFGEAATIKISLAASALGFVLMAMVEQDLLILLTVGFFVFSNAMLRPSIMSLTSKLSSGGQGMALGLNNSFQSLGRVAGPLFAGMLFDINILLPYLSASIIMLGTFVYALYAMSPVRMKAKLVALHGRTPGD